MRLKKNVLRSMMGSAGNLVASHPLKIISAFLLITALLLIPLSGLEASTEMDDFIPDSQYGDNEMIIREKFNSSYSYVGFIEADSGTVLDREGLMSLENIERRIRSDPLISEFLISYSDPVLTVADPVSAALKGIGNFTIEDAPEDILNNIIDEIEQEEDTSMLLGRQGENGPELGLIVIRTDQRKLLDDMDENGERVEIELESLMKSSSSKGYSVHTIMAWNEEMGKSSEEDLSLLIPICLIALTILLVISLGNLVDVGISFLGLILSLIISFGIFSLVGLPFTQMTFFAPIMILVLGIDFSIHVIKRYNEIREDGFPPEISMSRAIRFIGISVMLSALTTMVAFASNLTSSIPAIKSFGIFLAIGISVSFLVMVLFVPSLKVLTTRIKLPFRSFGSSGFNRIRTLKHRIGKYGSMGLVGSSRFAYRRPVLVLFLVLLLTSGGYFLSLQLERDLSAEELFRDDSDKLYTLDVLKEEFPAVGTESVNVIILGDLSSPDVLLSMEESITRMDSNPYIPGDRGTPNVLSIITFIKPMMDTPAFEILDENDDGLPDTRNGIVRMLNLIYEDGIPGKYSREEVRALLSRDKNGKFDATIMIVEVAHAHGNKGIEFENHLKDDIKPFSGLVGVEAKLSGELLERNGMLIAMTDGMIASTTLSILLCTIMVIVLFWSFRYGLIAALPVTLVTGWVLGTAYLLGYSLTPTIATSTAMTIGIGIDYSIHLVERYRQERRSGSAISDSIDRSVMTTGSSLVAAALTTSFGFSVIGMSRIGMFQGFGTLSAIIVVYVLVASILVLPSFIVVSEKMMTYFRSRHTGNSLIGRSIRRNDPIIDQ
jgi:predicted RND superfamily exporter protein